MEQLQDCGEARAQEDGGREDEDPDNEPVQRLLLPYRAEDRVQLLLRREYFEILNTLIFLFIILIHENASVRAEGRYNFEKI